MSRTTSRYCATCDQTTRHERSKSVGLGLGLLLTLLTAGLFLVVWIPVSFADDLGGHRCVFCGTKNGRFKKNQTPVAVRILCLVILILAAVLWSQFG